MQSFSRGWSFLKQSWQMAFADVDLLKPSLYALLAGFVVALLSIVPLGGAVLLFGGSENPIGQAIIGLVGAFFAFLQYAVTYVFSAMTVYLIYGYISEGDGKMEKAWDVVRRDWLDILSLAAASTLVNALKSAAAGKDKKGARNAIAELIDRVWTQATYLVLPIMVIEDVNLFDGLKRATYIVKNNLLLIGVSVVGVGAVTGLIGFGLGFVGIALGVGLAFAALTVGGSSLWVILPGIALGVFVASIFIMAASIINSYTSTAYHTCLYLWAREVERARERGLSEAAISAPAPLAAVLG
jgi:hypothetical protein